MSKNEYLIAEDVERTYPLSNYPEPFYSLVKDRVKRRLGDAFGLTSFGVNHTRLPPKCMSALFHKHSVQDEFIYILEGNPTLITENGEYELSPGMCAGFKAGESAHHLVNKSDKDVVYLEIGDRLPDDSAEYPNDDLKAFQDENKKWRFTHKNGSDYQE